MADTVTASPIINDLPDDQVPPLSHITATYVEIAEKMAEHTRLRHQELTKIIASIQLANQT
jgi:hypothetical protein